MLGCFRKHSRGFIPLSWALKCLQACHLSPSQIRARCSRVCLMFVDRSSASVQHVDVSKAKVEPLDKRWNGLGLLSRAVACASSAAVNI